MSQLSPFTGTAGKKPWRNFASIRQVRGALLAGLATLPLWLAGRAFALDPAKALLQFNCQHWTRQNGLPADKITDVTQSKDGYVWLATQNGLVRFDGRDFTVVPIALPAAQGQDVRKLTPASNGGVRFVINNGGFGSYDGKEFSAIGDGRWWQPGLDATTILEARDGAVWAAASSGTSRWLKENPAGSFFAATNTGIVLSFCEDASGRMWMGTAEHGLWYWDSGTFTEFPDRSLEKQDIFAVATGADGRIWVGTEKGLRCYAGSRPVLIPPLASEIKALLVDRHGLVWAGTTGQGLARFQNGEFTFLKKLDGLGSDNVLSLVEDAEGSLWAGTRDGLCQLSDVKLPIYSTRTEGLGEVSSHMVAAAKNGGLWIGTDAGISFCDGRTVTNSSMGADLPAHYIKLVFEARNGDLYAEDGDKNINVFSGNRLVARDASPEWTTAFAEDADSVLVARGTGDALFRLQDGKFTHYQYQPATPPDYYWINNLCVARDGAIWVASKNGIFRLQNGAVRHWTTIEGLSGNLVEWICEDGDGTIWAGLASGIARLKDGQIKNIKLENGLPDDWIYAIVPDNRGCLWVDSARGIFRVHRQSLNDFADSKAARVECELFDGMEAVKSTGRTDQEYSGCQTTDGRVWFPRPWGVVMIDPANIPTNGVAPPVHIERVLADGRAVPLSQLMTVPPGQGNLEIHFTGLSFVSAQNIRFRYRLESYDQDWVEAGSQRVAFYQGLKPGAYTFHVIAANSDGVWNQAGDTFKIDLHPNFRQTSLFYWLCGGLSVALFAGLYAGRVRHLEVKQRGLQTARDQLETEVRYRTADLARANDSLRREVEEHRCTGVLLAKRTQLLETEVAERKQMQTEIEHVHQRLLETSRQAGMAEVAANVLHNVGNVLNSVNVSAALVAEHARNSKVSYVGQAAALLEQHADRLGVFMTTDPKGRQLPGFLGQLAGQLVEEQQLAIAELELLRRNIEHIKDIVAMQQSYAKISGVTETLKLPELADDAVAMSVGALARHEIKFVREYYDAPMITVEKHKVLQILVNLIRNAKHACADSGRTDKKITLAIASADDGVRISVIDNGIGIPPENLAFIFNHGFTTRPGGHGFGLHSGALAARELGGSLSARSDGPGQGAAFTLILPLQPPPTET